MQVRIEGQKVVLRDFTEADIARQWHYHFEAEDREFMNWNGPYIPVEYETLEQAMANGLALLRVVGTDEPRRRLVIEIDGEMRGMVSRYWVDERTNWMETGIVIFDSRYWSGGYGTEAFQMWIDYLFTQLDVVRLGIATWSGNERMMRLASKIGMIEEARIRQARIVRGEYFDAIKMGMLRTEWEALRNSFHMR